MKNARKRISTLALALCMVLSMAVPMVWAAEEVVYNFDYIGLSGDENNTVSLIQTQGTVINDAVSAIENAELNWKYYSHNQSLASAANKVGGAMLVKNGYTFNASKNYSTKMGYIRMVTAAEGDYIALTIDNPGAGTKHITVDLAAHKFGVEVCNVYLLPADKVTDVKSEIKTATPVGAISFWNTGDSSSSDYSKAPVSTVDVGNWTPEEGYAGQYILVFEAAKLSRTAVENNNTSKMFISKLTMSNDAAAIAEAENAEAVLYHSETEGNSTQKGINHTTYCTVANALSNAAATDRIVLVNVANADTVTVPADVLLDLNGYTLTAGSVAANFADTNIVDGSSGDTGVLKVTTGNMALAEANKELPLYDSEAGGYRFFETTVTALGKTGTEQNKFWFKVSFTNADAYALAASQMDIGAGLTAAEITAITEAWAGTAFTASWSAAVASSQPSDICFTAKNFSSLTDFKLTPMVKANGVTVSGAAL